MKHKIKLYRQGDVLIQRIETIPSGLKQQPSNEPIILAHGEVTGHHHLVADPADWWKTADEGEQFISVTTPARVTHQEHATIMLPPGNYRVVRQREYSPEEVRRVQD